MDFGRAIYELKLGVNRFPRLSPCKALAAHWDIPSSHRPPIHASECLIVVVDSPIAHFPASGALGWLPAYCLRGIG